MQQFYNLGSTKGRTCENKDETSEPFGTCSANLQLNARSESRVENDTVNSIVVEDNTHTGKISAENKSPAKEERARINTKRQKFGCWDISTLADQWRRCGAEVESF